MNYRCYAVYDELTNCLRAVPVGKPLNSLDQIPFGSGGSRLKDEELELVAFNAWGNRVQGFARTEKLYLTAEQRTQLRQGERAYRNRQYELRQGE